MIVKLIENEIERYEKALYESALAVEQDFELNQEMKEWDLTSQDGLNNESR